MYDVMGVTVELLTPVAAGLPFCVMRGIIPAGAVIPMHAHEAPESFFVVSGEAQVLLEHEGGLRWKDLKPGDFVHVPPMSKHAHRNPSPTPAIEILVATPDIAEFFVEVGRPVPPSGTLPPPTPDEVERFAAAGVRRGHWLATPEENAAVGIVMS